MTTIFEIPLQTGTPQEFDIALSNRRYHWRLQYRNADQGGWILDMYDGDTNAPILLGIPLVTGINLLDQYDYLNLGGGLYVQTAHNQQVDPDNVPTFENLGSDGKLYWVTNG